MLKSLFAAALLVGLATAPALSEEWTYTDGTGSLNSTGERESPFS